MRAVPMVEPWCSRIVPGDCYKAWQTWDWGPGNNGTAIGT